MGYAQDALPHDTLQPQRRGLLALLTATTVVTARPARAVTDPHTAWWQDLVRLRAAAQDMEDEAAEIAFERVDRLERLIALSPARTVAGIAAQIALAVDHLEHSAGSDVSIISLRQAERSLTRLSGAPCP